MNWLPYHRIRRAKTNKKDDQMLSLHIFFSFIFYKKAYPGPYNFYYSKSLINL